MPDVVDRDSLNAPNFALLLLTTREEDLIERLMAAPQS